MSIRLFTDRTDETVVSLSKAIEAIEAESWREGNFVGFTNDLDETLQFIRVEQDEWLVDVPVYVGRKYANYSMKSIATTLQVKQMSKLFFEAGDWKRVVDLEDSRISERF